MTEQKRAVLEWAGLLLGGADGIANFLRAVRAPDRLAPTDRQKNDE